MFRPERVSSTLVNLMYKFSKHGDLLVDLFSGVFVTGSVCLEISWHRDLTGCKVDTDCFSARTEALDETFARQFLKENTYCSDTEEIVSPCKILVRV